MCVLIQNVLFWCDVTTGANKWCLDKNYASVFVLWDLLFGTFQLEKKDSDIVYGLTQQPQTHNAIWHQVRKFLQIYIQMYKDSVYVQSCFLFRHDCPCTSTKRCFVPDFLLRWSVPQSSQHDHLERLYESGILRAGMEPWDSPPGRPWSISWNKGYQNKVWSAGFPLEACLHQLTLDSDNIDAAAVNGSFHGKNLPVELSPI